MKNLILFFTLFITFPFYILPQTPLDINCPTLSENPRGNYAITGGKYKPSRNTEGQYLRVLIAFVQFEGDNSYANDWQTGSLPGWAYSFISTTTSSQYPDKTFSDYWNEMAVGEFDLIGTVFPDLIILPPENTYANASKSFSHTNLDALEIIDSWIPHNGPDGWNWAPYDNWKYDSGTQSFVFNPGNADGYIDMIFMIYRNATFQRDPTDDPGEWFGGGWGAFDGAAALGNIAINFITNDGYTVHAPGSPTNISALSSGITFRTGGPRGKWETLGLMAHEYGHYLFGGGHTNYTGIMGGGTYAMNGWERIKVNQIVPMVASGDGNQYYLGDFVATGNVLKIPIPISQPNSTTYFMVENHQRTSSYDHIIRGETIEGGFDYTGLGKGLFISIVKYGDTYATLPTEKFQLIAADGNFDWQYDGDFYAPGFHHTIACSNYVPKTKQINVNRESGKNDRMPRHIEWCITNFYASKWCDKDIYGNYWLSRDVMGDFTDAFTVSYNNLLTRWSNPSTYVGGQTDISIQLVNENAGICTVKVFSTYNSGLSLPPSKPQYLKVQAGQNNRPYLTWDANLEDDILRYEVWKKKFINGSWQWSFLASTTNNFYLDATEVFCGPPPAQCENQAYVYYKILAVDTQLLQSVFSDPVIAAVQGSPPDKISVDPPSTKKSTEYSLTQNYPNPFNPTTTIDYSIKAAGLVSLKVYDMLGTEVASLVNENKEAGNYSVTFNASVLPSGIYFYTLTSGNFMATKKLILLK